MEAVAAGKGGHYDLDAFGPVCSNPLPDIKVYIFRCIMSSTVNQISKMERFSRVNLAPGPSSSLSCFHRLSIEGDG